MQARRRSSETDGGLSRRGLASYDGSIKHVVPTNHCLSLYEVSPHNYHVMTPAGSSCAMAYYMSCMNHGVPTWKSKQSRALGSILFLEHGHFRKYPSI
jgi:hypothetical protein